MARTRRWSTVCGRRLTIALLERLRRWEQRLSRFVWRADECSSKTCQAFSDAEPKLFHERHCAREAWSRLVHSLQKPLRRPEKMPRARTHRREPVVENPRRMCRSRGGGTGRRSGLKIPWPEGRVGSIPAPGTLDSKELSGLDRIICPAVRQLESNGSPPQRTVANPHWALTRLRLAFDRRSSRRASRMISRLTLASRRFRNRPPNV